MPGLLLTTAAATCPRPARLCEGKNEINKKGRQISAQDIMPRAPPSCVLDPVCSICMHIEGTMQAP